MQARIEFRRAWLVVSVLAVALAPQPGAWLRWSGLPPEFGVFPPYRAGAAKPDFSRSVFLGCLVLAGLILSLLLKPTLLGFAPSGRTPRPRRSIALPWWFWFGSLVNAAAWASMWWGNLPTAAYAFVFLWWGFIVAVDGVVYSRTDGRSLLASKPKSMLALTLMSVPAWSLFEFLNYYVVEFWVYPNNRIFSKNGQTVWYLISFSTVWPAVFEWFTLLSSFERFAARWSRGPALELSPRVAVITLCLGVIAMGLLGAFPFELFPVLWVGPELILVSSLALLGLWTPLRPIREGNWSPVVLIGVAALVNGFFWELWNYGSEYFHAAGANPNPNYWYYDVPYVNRVHLFSEMPLLGYFGYLPFGTLVWVCWLIVAELFGLEPSLHRLDSPEAPVDPVAVAAQ